MHYKKNTVIIIAAVLLAGVFEANAQWVFVARKALGRIEQLTQSETKDQPGYDVATVVLEGNADKVYEVALKSIEKAPGLRITRRNPAMRTVEFTDGTISAGLKISQVNDTVVHLLIASVVMPDQPSGTSLVLAGVKRVCDEMGAHYSIEK
ncbi:MAG: hypothetical protein PHP98_09565 [Kiritimatiellae bacterium]|jgi:hypothetical protein|nr:hypothetical protein [Kiritimatiellia bacterium]